MDTKVVEDGKQIEDEPKKKGMALIIHDFKQKPLIPVKILFFVMFSSIGVLAPYLTIHMKSLGITVEETAIIYGIVPLFGLIAPSTMGMVADKLGNFKVLLCVILVVKSAVALLFLAIPTGRFIDTYPVNISLAVGCSPAAGHQGLLMLTDLDSFECDFKPSVNLSLTVEECGYVCLDSQTDHDGQEALSADWPAHNQPYTKYHNGIFFPESWGVDVDCSGRDNCTLVRTAWWETMDRNNISFDQVKLRNSSINIFTLEQMILSDWPKEQQMAIQCDADYDRPFRLNQPLLFKLNNTLKSDQGVLTLPRPSYDSKEESESVDDVEINKDITYQICRPQCIVRAPRKHICANKEHVVVFDPQLTFWLYMLLRLVFGILAGGSMVLFEGACLAIITRVKGDLGLQRIFGLIGLMVFSPVSGAMIDYFSDGLSIADYRPAFIMFVVMMTIAAVCVLFVDLDFKSPNSELFKDIKALLKNVELDVFFIVVFMSGLFWGYIESYLFWFLEEMGGTKSLMGFTMTISCLVGIPPLLLSDKIFRKIGHPNVQIIGFAVYIIRLLGYSYIHHPYMCLVYEVMEAVTTALMTTSMVAYSAELGTTTTLATIQGLVGATYYGLGKGAGSFIGGFLMKWLGGDSIDKTAGTRATFRVLGVAAAATGVLYFLFNIFYIRRRKLNALKNKKNQQQQQVDDTNANTKAGLDNPVFVGDEQTGPKGIKPFSNNN